MGRSKKSVFRKKMELRLGLWTLRVLFFVFRFIPYKVAGSIGSFLGGIVYYFARGRRRMTIENLRMAFPDWNEQKVSDISKDVFRNFGRCLIEFLKSPSITKEQVGNIWEIKNREYFDDALKQGKGLMLIAAHTGNWEMSARGLAMSIGYNVSVVTRDTDDSDTTDLINSIRAQGGYEVFSRGNAARFIMKALKNNRIVCILPDQNASDVFIDFFHHKAGSAIGPAVLHLKTGSPLIPAFPVLHPNGKHSMEIHPPIQYKPTGDNSADIRNIMQLIHAAIEKHIRQYPSQWLWMHDRWRSARQLSIEDNQRPKETARNEH